MTTLLSKFPAAYLINLPERKDRLRSATKELQRIGWKLGPGGVRLFPAQKFTDRNGFPNVGARGCFMSHMVCLEDAQRLGQSNVMLLEDDISFSSSLPRLTASILEQLENIRWDFCYLGHERTGNIAEANAKTAQAKLVPYSGEILMSYFVMINGRVVSRLIGHLKRVLAGVEGDQEYGPMPIDGAYNIFRRNNPDVQTVICVPKLGWQRSSRSDITPRPIDNWQAIKPLTEAIRNLKYLTKRWQS